MLAALYVNGSPIDPMDDDTESVALEFDTDGTPTHRCRACGDDLTETVNGFDGDSTGATCPNYEPTGDDSANEGPHDAERIPMSWCNSAGIRVDETTDSVTVSLSVGDPRGAFTFTVTRIPDDAESDLAGALVLHTPYPGEPMPHEPMTEIRPGAYVIGRQAAARVFRRVPGGHAA